MPDPSGQALESRMHRFRRDLPFILVSGHDRPYDEDDAGQAGHVECLYKPFRMEELDRCIRQLLGKNG
jgi:DNA-binding NtrC family response regulator